MGAKQSSTQKQPIKVFESQNNHPKFGGSEILQLENNEEYSLEIKHPVGSQEIFKKWEQNISKYTEQNQYADALYFPNYLNFKEEGMCGRSGIVKARYQFFPYLLKDQIKNRKALGQSFSEGELWYILYTTCCAGGGVHEKGYILGDVRPGNIFVNENGEIRVSNLYTFFDESTNYSKFLASREQTFVAPEQIAELQSGKIDSKVDLPLAQCFSIGLTMLSTLLVTDQSSLYTPQHLQFNQQQFNNEITKLNSLISINQYMIAIINGLCELDPRFRLSCREVIETLAPYEENILDLQNFEIKMESLPENVRIRAQNLMKINSSPQMFSRNVLGNRVPPSRPTATILPIIQKTDTINNHKQLSPFPPQQFSRQLSSIHPPTNIQPSFTNNSFQSYHSNQTSFTFQGPNNLRSASHEYSNNNITFNQDISGINGGPPSNFYSRTHNVNNNVGVSYGDHSITTSSNTMQVQGQYNSQNYKTNSIQKRDFSVSSQPPPQKIILPPQISSNSPFNQPLNHQPFNNPPNLPLNPQFLNAQNSKSIYIPTQSQFPINAPPSSIPSTPSPQKSSSQKPTLLSMGRQAVSIRPQNIDSYPTNPYSQSSTHTHTHTYKSYEDAMKEIDRKLEQSRRMFPE